MGNTEPFGTVFPVDHKAKEINVELLSCGFVENPEDWNGGCECHCLNPMNRELVAQQICSRTFLTGHPLPHSNSRVAEIRGKTSDSENRVRK
jgi:hypothetical protein